MLRQLTRKVMAGRDLSRSESREALAAVLSADEPDAAIASFLTALSIKGETADEVAGFAEEMRARGHRVACRHERWIDTAGTGGGPSTFNVSTTTAFVLAGAGLPVAKHGNRAIRSKSGSADVLSQLGVEVAASPEEAEARLNQHLIAFLFAPKFHPSMKRLAPIRPQLAHRTIFNVVGPLTNPANAPFQLIGAFSCQAAETMAQALSRLGTRRAWIVNGFEGLDELSGKGPNTVFEVAGGRVDRFEIHPSDFGLKTLDSGGTYPGGSPAQNAQITTELLDGVLAGPCRDIVLLNAAAGLHLALGLDRKTAREMAEASIDSGAARRALTSLQTNLETHDRTQ